MSELKDLLESLKQKALAATPGEWVYHDECGHEIFGPFEPSGLGGGGRSQVMRLHPNNVDDCKFVAAANPHAILTILDELECSMKLNDLTEDHISPAHWRSLWAELENAKMDKRQAEDELKVIKTENETLRKNSDRYLWMRHPDNAPDVEHLIWSAGDDDDFDAQVDAEIEKEKQP